VLTTTKKKCRRSAVGIFLVKKMRWSGEENLKPPLAVTGSVVDSPVFVHVVALLLIVILIIGDTVGNWCSLSDLFVKVCDLMPFWLWYVNMVSLGR
jgi:hypothetical protein